MASAVAIATGAGRLSGALRVGGLVGRVGVARLRIMEHFTVAHAGAVDW